MTYQEMISELRREATDWTQALELADSQKFLDDYNSDPGRIEVAFWGAFNRHQVKEKEVFLSFYFC